jgi:hypothetical protein
VKTTKLIASTLASKVTNKPTKDTIDKTKHVTLMSRLLANSTSLVESKRKTVFNSIKLICSEKMPSQKTSRPNLNSSNKYKGTAVLCFWMVNHYNPSVLSSFFMGLLSHFLD